MVTVKKRRREKKQQPGCLAYAVIGVLYSVVADRRQIFSWGGRRGGVLDAKQRYSLIPVLNEVLDLRIGEAGFWGGVWLNHITWFETELMRVLVNHFT